MFSKDLPKSSGSLINVHGKVFIVVSSRCKDFLVCSRMLSSNFLMDPDKRKYSKS